MAIQNVPHDKAQDVLNLSIAQNVRDVHDEEWERSKLPSTLRYRLSQIDRALHGLQGVTRILSTDARHCRFRDEFQGVAYEQLPEGMREALENAQEALMHNVLIDLERIKDSGRDVLID